MYEIQHLDVAGKVPFLAVSSADQKTRLTGLAGGWTVAFSLDGVAGGVITDTIVEADATNEPGIYWLDVDDAAMVTLAAAKDNAELVVTIQRATMETVTRTVLIKRFSPFDDEVLDKTTDPAEYRVHRQRRGTADKVGTKLLKDQDGAAISTLGVTIGQLIDA